MAKFKQNFMETLNKSATDSEKLVNGTKGWFSVLTDKLLSDLPERSREIVKKRFGLLGNKKETLEKIGSSYGVTRERVRQIIAEAIKRVSQKKEDDNFKKAEEKIISTIGESNGIIKETEVLEKLAAGNAGERNSISFLAACSKKIAITEEKGSIKKSWLLSDESLKRVKEIEVIAREIFQKERRPLTSKEIAEKIIASKRDLDERQVVNYLGVLSAIEKNIFGKWGLSCWSDINPKGTGERIYLVLKEKNNPLHFSEIARLIDEYGLSKKKAHPQTVHNELIKDERFVLIGRGIYALKEWGYARGTVKEVLEDILRKSGRALSREEILEKVFKIRRIKKSTILINLNNCKIFLREGNFYTIKKENQN